MMRFQLISIVFGALTKGAHCSDAPVQSRVVKYSVTLAPDNSIDDWDMFEQAVEAFLEPAFLEATRSPRFWFPPKDNDGQAVTDFLAAVRDGQDPGHLADAAFNAATAMGIRIRKIASFC